MEGHGNCQDASSWQCSSSNYHTSSAHLLPRWRSVERRAAVGLRRGGGAAKRMRAKAEVRRLCRRRVGIKGVLRHNQKGQQSSPPKDHTPKVSLPTPYRHRRQPFAGRLLLAGSTECLHGATVGVFLLPRGVSYRASAA